VAFSPDGSRLASGSDDRTVKTWHSATGKELSTFKGHTETVTTVAFSPDGQRLASGSADGTVRIWNSAPEFLLIGHAQWVPAAALGSDRWVSSVAFSPDGRRLASGSPDKTVKVWDTATGKELLSLEDHDGQVHEAAFGPDGHLLSSFSAGGVSTAFGPDGRRLASGSHDGMVKVWDTATGKQLLSLTGHAGWVWSMAFSPDGERLASGSADGRVKIWDSTTGKELLSLTTDGAGSVLAFSPDGRRLAAATANNKTAKVWDSATGKELLSLKGLADYLTSMAFRPDGRRLVTVERRVGKVKFWDSETGKQLVSLQVGEVSSLAFSPDGRRLALGCEDGFIKVWETDVPPDVQEPRVTAQLVVDLFRELGLRADVLKRLHTMPGLSPSRRQAALADAQTVPESPRVLHALAWELVKMPGREVSRYRQALRFSEAACRLEPNNGNYVNTLGMAYYRVGNNDKALETLLRSDSIHQKQAGGSTPADLAFLAMTRHRLGHTQEAQADLRRLRERVKEPHWAQDADAQGFLREAEALLATAKPPGKQ
jgi:WD40 repeat protein